MYFVKAVNYVRTVDALRQALYRRRAKERGKLGPVPKTTEELIARGVPELFRRTCTDEPFLRYVLQLVAYGTVPRLSLRYPTLPVLTVPYPACV